LARSSALFDASVVHALLQARYYDSGKGAFLSEDPVFLADPKQQVLTDPQSLNSYSYGNDNPITKSDPNGKFGALAAAPFLLEGEELASGPIGWGALGVTALISGAYLMSNRNFQTSIQVNTQYNEITDLQNKVPNDPGGKIIALTTGAALLAYNQRNEIAGFLGEIQPYVGLSGSWTLPRPTMVNKINYPKSTQISAYYPTTIGTPQPACSVLCMTPSTGSSPRQGSAAQTSSSKSSQSTPTSQSWGVAGPGSFNPYQPH
jgi:RHS repeat-associated protein